MTSDLGWEVCLEVHKRYSPVQLGRVMEVVVKKNAWGSHGCIRGAMLVEDGMWDDGLS